MNFSTEGQTKQEMRVGGLPRRLQGAAEEDGLRSLTNQTITSSWLEADGCFDVVLSFMSKHQTDRWLHLLHSKIRYLLLQVYSTPMKLHSLKVKNISATCDIIPSLFITSSEVKLLSWPQSLCAKDRKIGEASDRMHIQSLQNKMQQMPEGCSVTQ